jgi:hypothetical protein
VLIDNAIPGSSAGRPGGLPQETLCCFVRVDDPPVHDDGHCCRRTADQTGQRRFRDGDDVASGTFI